MTATATVRRGARVTVDVPNVIGDVSRATLSLKVPTPHYRQLDSTQRRLPTALSTSRQQSRPSRRRSRP